MSLDFTKNISQFIEAQFPEFYRSEGETMVAFIKAYYEFLESNSEYSLKLSRQMFDIRDIDESLSQFIVQFRAMYLDDFPVDTNIDKRFLLKHIQSYYKTKGSKQSLELLMRILFNESADVYIPADDILRVSDSTWVSPQYFEVTTSPRTASWVGQQVTGFKSGATAFVEDVVRKRVNGKIFDQVLLSQIRGTFQRGEQISNDGVYRNAPKIRGSLTSITVNVGGRENAIGDIFDVISVNGVQGVAKVSEITSATGRVDFQIVDGGWGFTTTDSTNVYVANSMLFVDNADQSFIELETVYQPVETLRLDSAADILGQANLVGSYIVGKNGSTVVANGVIVSVSNTDINGNVMANASSFGTMTLITTSGTFAEQKQIMFTSNTGFVAKEFIDEESAVTIVFENASAAFTPNSIVDQRIYQTVGNEISGLTSTLTTGNTTITIASTSGLVPGQPLLKASGAGVFASGTYILEISNSTDIILNKAPTTSGAVTFTAQPIKVLDSYAVGKIATANTSTLTLTEVWGVFASNTIIREKSTGVVANPTQILTTTQGARGQVTAASGNTAVIEVTYGAFTVGKKVRSRKTSRIVTISTIEDSGATIAYLNGNNSANGIIRDGMSEYIEGIVVGQNESSIGVYGNAKPFWFSSANSYTSYIFTRREEMVSPPKDSLGNIINLQKQINRIAGGRDAYFSVGVIEAVENNVTLYTDIVGDKNVANVEFLDISLDGTNSGFGYVSDVVVVNGGTGYSNSFATVTFSGGGFADGEPLVPAEATIVTDVSGTITRVTLDSFGSGYYTSPTLTLSPLAGSGANLTPVMTYGYGFPKNPNAQLNNLIIDCLDVKVEDVGKIAVLGSINPGTNYTADPFVLIRNKYIAPLLRYDLILRVTNVTGGEFAIGESIQQVIGSSTFVKGIVKDYVIANGTSYVYLERQSIAVSFDDTYPIVGGVTGVTATLIDVTSDYSTQPIGMNGNISSTAIYAEGIATKLDIVDSGFAHINDEVVTLKNDASNYIITGTAKTSGVGKSRGYWSTTSSHLNSDKMIQDSDYYQEYSYDVQVGISLNKYEKVLKDVFHVAGNKLFGSVVKTSNIDLSTEVVYSSVVEIETA